jgi:hypothetical protein
MSIRSAQCEHHGAGVQLVASVLVRVLVLGAALLLPGCVNLPPQVRVELECAAPDHFGNADCAPGGR